MENEVEKVVNVDVDMIAEDKEDSLLTSVAKRFAAIEEPLPEVANMESLLEMLGRIEHELVVYRRERLLKTYMWLAVLLIPILGLSFLVPSFLRGFIK